MNYYTISDESNYEENWITQDHFGLNLVTIYDEEFVDPTSELSKNVLELGASTLRYPGGAVTEYLFDMNDPNKSFSTYDPTQTLTPMDMFFEQAGTIGAAVTIVIPTRVAFEESAPEAMLNGDYGDRVTVSVDYLQDVMNFVSTSVAYAERNDVKIQAFEIGNEFWGSGEMTAKEYGILAGKAASLIDGHLKTLDYSEVDIAVQSTSGASILYSPKDDLDAYVGIIDDTWTAFSQEDVDRDYSGVLPEDWIAVTVPGQGSARFQVSQIAESINSVVGAAEAVDALVQHYYQKDGFAGVDNGQQFKFERFQQLEDELNRSSQSEALGYHITEWNTGGFDAANNRGLQNAAMIVEKFFELVTNGVDVAQIWPLSFDAAQGASMVDLDGDGLSISGEIFRLMSESLVGLTPVLDWSVPDEIDIHGFSSSQRAVFFVSERSGAMQSDVTLDVGEFFGNKDYVLTNTQLWDGGAGGEDASANPQLEFSGGYMSDADTITFDLNSWAIRRIEVTFVGEGEEEIVGRSGHDEVSGYAGDDTVDGGGGDDTVIGGPGDDRVLGGAGDDELTGGNGRDTLLGGGGDDLFFAQAGDDHVVGGDGIDSIHLGIGSDVYEGNGSGGDIVRGLAGHDTITGGSDGDLLLGHLGLDVISGEGGNDTIRAGIARDYISGGEGDDLLDAAPGWDFLDGGAGNDTLIGSLGNDQMTGGTGADTFVFTARSGWDTVTDYEDGIDMLSITYPGRSFGQLVIRTDGDNTTVWYGSGGIILEDIDAAQITADDFLFS